MIYARILEPSSKRSAFRTAQDFLEPPAYQLHDVYRALDVLGKECDFIQAEFYKNSHLMGKRNDKILYYDCTNYYFEIEQEDGDKKYGKCKEHRPNPIIQMRLFMDGDGIPLAFSLFPGNANEQTSLKPLEEKVLTDFGCQKFIYCSDAGLGSEQIRNLNHMGERAFIVTQSIKKLPKEDRQWALCRSGFKRVADDMPVDITQLGSEDTGLYYKEDLREMNFACIKDQGYIPLYRRSKLTDALHETCGFHTDYEIITKRQPSPIPCPLSSSHKPPKPASPDTASARSVSLPSG